jgi:ribosomal protein S12 methylthiotransferase
VDGAVANGLPDAVPEDVKEARRAQFMTVQARISARRLAAKVGRTLDVLVDTVENGVATARTAGDAPEIDGIVRVTGGHPAPGEFVRVRITAADLHDLDAVAIG